MERTAQMLNLGAEREIEDNMTSNSETRNITAFSDTELVAACRKGDLDAFEWLVEKYQNVALLALALSYIT